MKTKELEYIVQEVARWIAAGDVPEADAETVIATLCNGFDLRFKFDRPEITVQQWCGAFHEALKAQETMDPKEYARQKRLLQRARKQVLKELE